MSIRITTVAALLALAASGCGFQLQGRTPLPPALTNTYVVAGDQQTDFVQGLRKALITSGSKLASRGEDSTGTVRIITDSVTRKILSVSANNVPREYEITYTVEFSVSAPGKELLPIQTRSGAARLLVLGGEPLGVRLKMWWNFVARTEDEITQAWRDWRDGDDDRFGPVPSALARIEAPTPPWLRGSSLHERRRDGR